MALRTVTTIPEVLRIKILCLSAGMGSCPHLTSDWLCEGITCCFYHDFGFKELWETQCLCFGPCTSCAFNTTWAIPAMFTINLLCFKCGIQEFPDYVKGPFIYHKFLGLEYDIGIHDLFSGCQVCCLAYGQSKGTHRIIPG